MPRPVTLFTGQWADLPVADLAARCADWGYDGLELACWGDHFDVVAALSDDAYVREHRALLESHGLHCWAIGSHLIGQAVCDPIDARHAQILPPEIWGDGEPEGVRSARRGAHEGRRARRRALRGDRRHRLHRLADLAPALLLPAQRLRRRSSAATRSSPSAGARSSTSSTPRACASRSRCTRPRSPTTSRPPRRRWRPSGAVRASASTSIPATSCPSCSIRRRSSTSSPTASTTSTSRTRSAASTGAARSSPAT